MELKIIDCGLNPDGNFQVQVEYKKTVLAREHIVIASRELATQNALKSNRDADAKSYQAMTDVEYVQAMLAEARDKIAFEQKTLEGSLVKLAILKDKVI